MHHLSVQKFPAVFHRKTFALKRYGNLKLTECLDSIGSSNSNLISFGAVSGLKWVKVDAKPKILIKYKVSNTKVFLLQRLMYVKSNHTFDINCHCDSIIDFLANYFVEILIFPMKKYHLKLTKILDSIDKF